MEIDWKPFWLHPEIPREGRSRAEVLGELINHHYLVMGAQPLETLVEVVERVQAEESQV